VVEVEKMAGHHHVPVGGEGGEIRCRHGGEGYELSRKPQIAHEFEFRRTRVLGWTDGGRAYPALGFRYSDPESGSKSAWRRRLGVGVVLRVRCSETSS
jgi:hypothetical protein